MKVCPLRQLNRQICSFGSLMTIYLHWTNMLRTHNSDIDLPALSVFIIDRQPPTKAISSTSYYTQNHIIIIKQEPHLCIYLVSSLTFSRHLEVFALLAIYVYVQYNS